MQLIPLLFKQSVVIINVYIQYLRELLLSSKQWNAYIINNSACIINVWGYTEIFPIALPRFVTFYLFSRTAYSFLPELFTLCYSLCYLHLDPREKIASPKWDLFCSRKPLTYPGSASVQCGLHWRTGYPLSQALTFFTQTSVSYWTLLLSRKSYTCTVLLSSCECSQTAELTCTGVVC